MNIIEGTHKRCGCRYEIFEECLYDIDLAINTAKELGYKQVILLGHSYGCNKVIYYYYKKKPSIKGIILASAPDMCPGDVEHNDLLEEAKINIDENQPMKLLHKMVEDYMYFSSQTYYNWYKEDSNLDNLPVLRNPEKWEQLSTIDVPILTFSGEGEEDRYLHLDLLEEKATSCPKFNSKIIDGSGHTYKGKEQETGELILKWIINLLR